MDRENTMVKMQEQKRFRNLLRVVAMFFLVSCTSEGKDVVTPKTAEFPEATMQWIFPTIDKDRTYFMTLPVDSNAQWYTDAEAALRELFDAGLPLETAWFNLWPSDCWGHTVEGIITVDLTKPDARIIDLGFASSSPFWCPWGGAVKLVHVC